MSDGWTDQIYDILGLGQDDDDPTSDDEDTSPLADGTGHKYTTGGALTDTDTPASPRPDELPPPSSFDVFMLTSFRNGQVCERRTVHGLDVLYVDPSNIPDQNQEAMATFLEEGKQELGGITPAHSEPIISALHGGGNEYADSLGDFFQGKVPTRFVEMIKDAALLRYAEANHNLSRRDVRDWKSKMASNGGEAFNVSALCSSGFFDVDGLFQEKYRERVDEGDYTEDDYEHELIRAVRNPPFVVFVRSDPEVAYDVDDDLEPYKHAHDDALQKARYIDDFPWNFDYIQVRGTGDQTHPIVQNTAGYFREEYDDLDCDLYEEHRDLVFEFDPDTLG